MTLLFNSNFKEARRPLKQHSGVFHIKHTVYICGYLHSYPTYIPTLQNSWTKIMKMDIFKMTARKSFNGNLFEKKGT